MNRWMTAQILLLAMLGHGCAGLLRNGTGNTFTVRSIPEGAEVLVDSAVVGRTPYTHTHRGGTSARTDIVLRLDGYEDASFPVEARPNKGALFADAMLFNLPLLVDRKSPYLWSYDEEGRTIVLKRPLNKELEPLTVPLTGVENKVGTAELGRVNGTPIRGDEAPVARELGRTEQLLVPLQQGVRSSWLKMPTARLNTTAGKEAVTKAKVHVRPRITAVNADLKERRDQYSGTLTLSVDWCFYSGLDTDSLLFTHPVTEQHHLHRSRGSDLLEEALQANARSLLEVPGLHDRIDSVRRTGMTLARGALLEVPRPKAIAFEGRRDMLSALVNAVVTVETGKGHGSGFLISNTGHLLTNQHVVENVTEVKVRFAQGFTLQATVVKMNVDQDLALLKAEVTDVPALTIGDDGGLLVGEELFAIGTPLDTELGQSVSRGILSGKRTIEGRELLQTDVSINPGNSGGPLVDTNGHVVGVASAKITGRGLEGLGFGIPIRTALDMLNIRMVP